MLAKLSSVKTRLGLEQFDTTDDATLTNLLKHVSARFAAECNRVFDYDTGLTHEFHAEQTNIVVDRPPIESVSAFHVKSTEAEGWIGQAAVDYVLLPKRAVVELPQPLGVAGQLGRITYSGGFILPGAAPSGSQIALPDDIEQSCIEQVAYWYQRRSQLGLLSVSSEGGMVQQFQASDLLPQVRAVLMHYERFVN